MRHTFKPEKELFFVGLMWNRAYSSSFHCYYTLVLLSKCADGEGANESQFFFLDVPHEPAFCFTYTTTYKQFVGRAEHHVVY